MYNLDKKLKTKSGRSFTYNFFGFISVFCFGYFLFTKDIELNNIFVLYQNPLIGTALMLLAVLGEVRLFLDVKKYEPKMA